MMMKKLKLVALLVVGVSYSLLAQTVDVQYLDPKNGTDVSVYKYIRVGNSSNYWAGFMMNKADANYGNGEDFSIFTYNNRDMTFRTGTGNIVFFPSAGGKIGVGTTSPEAKLDVRQSSNTEWAAFVGNGGGSGKGLRIKSGASSDVPTLQVEDNYGNIRMIVKSNGKVGIGTANPGNYQLAVEGKIGAREVNVTTAAWADFVFQDDYVLRPLAEVEQFIKQKKHLPDVPSEAEVLEKGIELGSMDAKLLQKIEELTLYTIEQEKRLNQKDKELQKLKEEIAEIKAMLK